MMINHFEPAKKKETKMAGNIFSNIFYTAAAVLRAHCLPHSLIVSESRDLLVIIQMNDVKFYFNWTNFALERRSNESGFGKECRRIL